MIEIVRRNVKQVILQLQSNGMQYQQYLINQYVNGQKSQYEFLLPKSKNHHYYLQQLAQNFPQNRQRKLGSSPQPSNPPQQPTSQYHQNYPKNTNSPQPQHQKLLVIGTVQQVSVGAMCQLIKQLRQNTEPYEPFENQVYEQDLELNFNDPRVEAKFQMIMGMVEAIRRPEMKKTRSEESPEKSVNVKTELVRSQFGTQKDGSMGRWGGKKYEGLGMRDEFTDYRKKLSKNFYQSIR